MLGLGDDLTGLPHHERLRGLPEAARERIVTDPLGVSDRHLVKRQGRQPDGGGGDDGDPGQR